MEDLELSAVWTKANPGEYEWNWSVRGGVDNIDEFLNGINVNQPKLKIPSANLALVDLK